jgi:hypothetical protein
MDVQLNHTLGDATHLRAAIDEADIVPLLLVLAHLSGDEAILDEAAPYIHGAWNFMHTVPAARSAAAISCWAIRNADGMISKVNAY